jgi:hypothetical protein
VVERADDSSLKNLIKSQAITYVMRPPPPLSAGCSSQCGIGPPGTTHVAIRSSNMISLFWQVGSDGTSGTQYSSLPVTAFMASVPVNPIALQNMQINVATYRYCSLPNDLVPHTIAGHHWW